MADSGESKQPKDWMDAMLSREKKPSPLGTAIFVGIRAADVALQYGILRQGWGMKLVSVLGGTPVPFATPRDSALVHLGLGPYPAFVTLMTAVGAAEHIIWAIGIKEYELSPYAAVVISGFEVIVNTANTVLACWSLTSQAPSMDVQSVQLSQVVTSSPAIVIGTSLFAVGIGIQLAAEFQRSIFKSKPESKGKPYGGGLWSFATHINYGAFTLWRSGYALSTGGPTWAVLTFAAFFYDFTQRAIPSLDTYLSDKVSLHVLLQSWMGTDCASFSMGRRTMISKRRRNTSFFLIFTERKKQVFSAASTTAKL